MNTAPVMGDDGSVDVQEENPVQQFVEAGQQRDDALTRIEELQPEMGRRMQQFLQKVLGPCARGNEQWYLGDQVRFDCDGRGNVVVTNLALNQWSAASHERGEPLYLRHDLVSRGYRCEPVGDGFYGVAVIPVAAFMGNSEG